MDNLHSRRLGVERYGVLESDHTRPISLRAACIALMVCLFCLGGVIGWIVRAVVTR